MKRKGETLSRWRKDSNEKERRNPSCWKEDYSEKKRRSPNVQEGETSAKGGEANAARRSPSEPSAQGRRTITLQGGALAFKFKP